MSGGEVWTCAQCLEQRGRRWNDDRGKVMTRATTMTTPREGLPTSWLWLVVVWTLMAVCITPCHTASLPHHTGCDSATKLYAQGKGVTN